MKKLIFLMVSFLGIINSHSQSDLESEFVKQLNIYRKNHGLGPVKYDPEVSKIALYHSKYMAECKNSGHSVNFDKMPHDEQFDLKDHKELDFDERASMAPNKNIWGEISIAYNPVKKGESIYNIVKSMIRSFDSSPKHKEIMLCEDVSTKFTNVVGVSIYKTKVGSSEYDVYSINIDFGVLTP